MAKGRDGNEASDHWETPENIYLPLYSEFLFDFDPCPINATFDSLDDNFEWDGQSIFVNPPYNRKDKPRFIDKGYREWYYKNKTVVFLIPAATGTKQFHKYFWDKEKHQPREGVEIRLLEGRVAFKGINSKGVYSTKNKGKHDSCLIILRAKKIKL